MGAPLSPAHAFYLHVSGEVLFTAIPLIALCLFSWTLFRRLAPMRGACPDPRFDHPAKRLVVVLRYWLLQWKHPRYAFAGLLHIVIFFGFLLLALRSMSLVLLGALPHFDLEANLGPFATFYDGVKDYAATAVLIAVIVAAVRRAVFKPARYAPRPGDTHSHTAEALTVLGLIALLMISESVFSAAATAPKFTMARGFESLFVITPAPAARSIRLNAYLVHEITFFAFLCFLPFGKHFHVLTSVFNIFFAKLERGAVKPPRWDVDESELDRVSSLGVRKLQDFTWKHLLDFYSCADCGRCSDNCPAHLAGRPLSPRFLTIKGRDLCFEAFPMFGRCGIEERLIGNIYSEDEAWSCTTCGACEQECPMQIEYIDKIVDLRRALVEDGAVPPSFQKPLKALESRGNPYGKMEKKRGDWAKGVQQQVKVLGRDTKAETLFFVDSASSYDVRLQRVALATAQVLSAAGENFAILGPAEKDSGHDIRRFGEESLFQLLRQQNTEAILGSGATKVVTADPHAFNALRHDYHGVPPVQHISQFLAQRLSAGKLRMTGTGEPGRVVTYHDPCYLGRHNLVYDEPREVLDAIPGMKRVEMSRCRDRSFCCGGGGLMLFYEAKENERIGVMRIRMAAEAGANTVVTGCPFCLTNLEDAVKVAGLEKQMQVMDLTELVAEHLTKSTEVNPVPVAEPLATVH